MPGGRAGANVFVFHCAQLEFVVSPWKDDFDSFSPESHEIPDCSVVGDSRGLQVAPDNFRIWEGLANSYCWAQQVALAESALEQAAAAARRSEDQVNAGRISSLHCGKLMQQ